MSKTPKLRFKEFSGDWEENKLQNMSDVRDGTHDSPKYVSEGYPFITSKNLMTNGKIDFSDINYITEEDYININKRSKVDIGDILFGMIGTIGNPVIVEQDGFAIKNVALIKEKTKLLNKYLIQVLKSSVIDRQFYKLNTGGTQKFIGLGMIRDLNILTPKVEEQDKIASFFSLIDDKISLQSNKVESFKDYKKGIMQKIFSRELRFKDDDGRDYPEWEYEKLEVLCNIKKGEQLNKDSLISTGKYYALNGGIEPSGYTDKYNTESDTISISEGGNSCGYVNYNFERFWSGGHCYTLENISECIDNKYLYQFLKHNQLKIMGLRVGSGLPNIQKKDLTIFKVDIPCIEEQLKISKLLFDIDRKIKLEQEKLNSLNEYKKVLLQQMFV